MLDMRHVTVRPYDPADGVAVLALQLCYAARYPGAQVVGPDVYAHPGFEEGATSSALWMRPASCGVMPPSFPARRMLLPARISPTGCGPLSRQTPTCL